MPAMIQSKHFALPELLPKDFYAAHYPKYGDRLWLIFDARILMAADALRERYGRMLCNTWHAGGDLQYRGFRPPGCTVGAALSQHRFARALDLSPIELTAEELRQDLRRNFYKGKDPLDGRNRITRIEDGVDWLHIDCANVVSDTIIFFKA